MEGESTTPTVPTLFFLDIGLSNSPAEFFNRGRILAGSPDGSAPRELVVHQHLPDGIAVSESNGKLYWTSMGIPTANDGAIWSCNLDGGDSKPIVLPGQVHTPKQTFLDKKNNKLYFSDREGLRVFRCDLDGSSLEILIETGSWQNPEHQVDQTKWCVGVAVSPATGKFYWTQKGPSKGFKGRIFRANIDFPIGQTAANRTDVECLFQNLPEPVDLEIDEADGLLYWTDRGELPLGNSINRVEISKLSVKHGIDGTSLPGKDYDLLVRNLHEAVGLALDKVNRRIYTTDLGGTVYSFDMDGQNKKKIYDGDGAYAGITLAYL